MGSESNYYSGPRRQEQQIFSPEENAIIKGSLKKYKEGSKSSSANKIERGTTEDQKVSIQQVNFKERKFTQQEIATYHLKNPGNRFPGPEQILEFYLPGSEEETIKLPFKEVLFVLGSNYNLAKEIYNRLASNKAGPVFNLQDFIISLHQTIIDDRSREAQDRMKNTPREKLRSQIESRWADENVVASINQEKNPGVKAQLSHLAPDFMDKIDLLIECQTAKNQLPLSLGLDTTTAPIGSEVYQNKVESCRRSPYVYLPEHLDCGHILRAVVSLDTRLTGGELNQYIFKQVIDQLDNYLAEIDQYPRLKFWRGEITKARDLLEVIKKERDYRDYDNRSSSVA